MDTQTHPETDTAPQAQPPQRPAFQPPDFSKAKKRGRVRKIIVLALVLALAAAAIFFVRRQAATTAQQAAAQYDIVAAQARDIAVSLNGSGALSAADSYMVTSLLQGEILSAPFEEGDWVEKDAVLYTVDSSDLQTTIERAELSLSQGRLNYDRKVDSQKDLSIKAREPGMVSALPVKKGDTVMAGQVVAMVRDSAVMSLTVPFGAQDAQQLYVGQGASVTLDGSYETLWGTVAEISRVDQVLAGNMVVRNVVIDVQNPGGISPGSLATATVGDYACNGAGAFAYKSDYTLTAALSGEVAAIHVKEGDTVYEGQALITLDSSLFDMELESARNTLRDAELNLESQQDRLDGYTIQSPIAGTIIEKHYKAGDTLESGRVLCTIFDLRYLELTLNIDELDIAQVAVGQTVTVTADAAPGRQYQGVVTKVNINGTTLSGVTSYPVSIRMDDTDGLLPGMNVDATIRIANHQGVLAIPSGAVLRGNRVLVQRDPDAVAERGDTSGIPPGFEYVNVQLGADDGEYVQVLSGIAEGELVAVSAAMEGNFIMTPFGRIEMPQGMGGN